MGSTIAKVAHRFFSLFVVVFIVVLSRPSPPNICIRPTPYSLPPTLRRCVIIIIIIINMINIIKINKSINYRYKTNG